MTMTIYIYSEDISQLQVKSWPLFQKIEEIEELEEIEEIAEIEETEKNI